VLLLAAVAALPAQRLPAPPSREALRAAEARLGTAPEPWLGLAAGWLAQGDTAAAVRLLETGVATARPDRLLRLALAEVRVRRGEYRKAEQVLRAVPATDTVAAPLRAVLAARRAMDAIVRGDTAQAVRNLEQAWRVRRDEATGLALVQLYRLSRSPKGGPLADSLVARPSASAAAFAAAADVAAAREQLARAESLLVRGTARHGRQVELWMALGDVRGRQQRWAEGELAYRRAASLMAEPSPAELAVARLHLLAGDTAAAQRIWHGMTRGRPPAVVHQAAQRLRRFGAAAAAESAYTALASDDPYDAPAWTALAELAESRGDTADALAKWRRADDAPGAGVWPGLARWRLEAARDTAARRRGAARALWRGLAWLRENGDGTPAAEPLLVTNMVPDAPHEPEARRVAAAVQRVADALARDPEWGTNEIASARRAFGDGRLLLLAVARAARAQGQADSAARVLEVLVERHPLDAELRAEYATALAAAARYADAQRAWVARFEQLPGDTLAFRALVALANDSGTLASLAARVQWLRERRPGSVPLAEQAVELWHRLGRTQEATAAAAELAALRRRAEAQP
jgi:tetratricopeptide (TPR) repeat protein